MIRSCLITTSVRFQEIPHEPNSIAPSSNDNRTSQRPCKKSPSHASTNLQPAVAATQCSSSRFQANDDLSRASIIPYSANGSTDWTRCWWSMRIIAMYLLRIAQGIIIDCEHGHIGDDSMHGSTAAIAAMGVSPLVRIRMTHPDLIKRALDTGAQ